LASQMVNSLQLQVIDIGARYGLHPSLALLQDRCEILLIEPDPDEANRLTSQYLHSPRTTVMPVAVGTSGLPRILHLRRHRGLSGFYDAVAPKSALGSEAYSTDQLVEVKAVPLASVLTGSPTFLKIDCEGSEYDVLLSAGVAIKDVIGIRIEISLQITWAEGPLFHDLHSFLLKNHFELVCFETTAIDEEWGLFALPKSKRRFVSGEALYLRTVKELDSGGKVLSASLFCYVSGAEGLGLEILGRADRQTLRNLRKSKDPCEELLYAHVLRHLVEARRLPYYGPQQVDDLHTKLFGCPLPNRDEIFASLMNAGLLIP